MYVIDDSVMDAFWKRDGNRSKKDTIRSYRLDRSAGISGSRRPFEDEINKHQIEETRPFGGES